MSLTPLLMKVALLGAEWVLWLLLFLSAVSMAIVFQKTIFFVRARMPISQVSRGLRNALLDGGLKGGKEYLALYAQNPQARIVLSGLEEASGGKESIENAMAASQAIERSAMERNLGFLATLGNNAPFIGLLGTVIGIMGAFYKLHLDITGGTSVVMKDISEALVATAVGLFVAIPAVIFNNIFRQKVRKILLDATVLGSVLISYVQSQKK